jgi:hypothetical protein
MCNRFRSRLAWVWTEDFSETKVPLRFPDPLPELRPTDPHAVLGLARCARLACAATTS